MARLLARAFGRTRAASPRVLLGEAIQRPIQFDAAVAQSPTYLGRSEQTSFPIMAEAPRRIGYAGFV